MSELKKALMRIFWSFHKEIKIVKMYVDLHYIITTHFHDTNNNNDWI